MRLVAISWSPRPCPRQGAPARDRRAWCPGTAGNRRAGPSGTDTGCTPSAVDQASRPEFEPDPGRTAPYAAPRPSARPGPWMVFWPAPAPGRQRASLVGRSSMPGPAPGRSPEHEFSTLRPAAGTGSMAAHALQNQEMPQDPGSPRRRSRNSCSHNQLVFSGRQLQRMPCGVRPLRWWKGRLVELPIAGSEPGRL